LTRICLLTRTLEHTGGAERQLVNLAFGLKQRDWDVRVICFYGIGLLRSRLEEAGVSVFTTSKRGRWDPGFLWGLRREIRRVNPAILHSYLEPPNVTAALLGPTLPQTKVVWGVRSSDMERHRYGRTYSFVSSIEARLSSIPNLIIANSRAGRDVAISRGMPAKKIEVVPNGIDVEHFRPNPETAKWFRAELQVDASTRLLGRIARFDPMKDYETFLRGVAIVNERYKIHVVCVGDAESEQGRMTKTLAEELGLSGKITWLPPRDDVAPIIQSLDMLVSSSAYGEGFSNVIAEAMACGVLVVATDVGDSAEIVHDPDMVARPRDPQALAIAMESGLKLPSDKLIGLKRRNRRRVVENFSLASMVQRTIDAYQRLDLRERHGWSLDPPN
jgi:glycosyltransferase involved in cell wall biosynthesis